MPKIYSCQKNFVEAGCFVRHAKSSGRPRVSDATVEQSREKFVGSPRKLTPHGLEELLVILSHNYPTENSM
jgi:hypothetical protein